MGWTFEDGEEELRLEWQILKRFLNSKKILNKISKLYFEIKKRYLTTTSTLPLTSIAIVVHMPDARRPPAATSTSSSPLPLIRAHTAASYGYTGFFASQPLTAAQIRSAQPQV